MNTLVEEKQAFRLIFEQDVITVGKGGVTAIKRVGRNGEYCEIPYFEVWRGEQLHAEYSQHKIVGVEWFDADSQDDITF